MRLTSVAKLLLAITLAVPVVTAFTVLSADEAFAQGQGNGGGRGNGGGGNRGGGKRGGGGNDGGRLHFDKCYSGLADFCRPKIEMVPQSEVYYAPEYYEVPQGPGEKKKPVKVVKTKKPTGTVLAAKQDFVPDEVIVEVPLTTPESDVDALAQQQKIQKLGSTEISLLNTRIYRWRITDGRPVATVVAALNADNRIAGANFNRIFSLQQNLASAGPPQYAAEKMKLTDVHRLTRGENVLVALIDSGADASHPELKGAIAETFDAVGGKFEPHAHGTGMAGAMVGQALLNGVAPKARILNVRAFAPTGGPSENGTTFDVVRGMDWAAQKGARVFNLSFAGPQDQLMSRAIQAAIKRGIVVVAAAGNAGPKSPPLFPGAERGVIAVTSTDAADGIGPFANRGDYVTVAAPGVDILLPAPKKAYTVSSGTSVSAAYVSGMAALLISRHPDAQPKEIAAVLAASAKDLGPKGRDRDFGAGLANPMAALEIMDPVAQAAATPAPAPRPAQLAPAVAAQPVLGGFGSQPATVTNDRPH
jgi:subtilisin family serine protease